MKKLLCALGLALAATAPAFAAEEVLRASGRQELAGYTGDLDHLAYDLAGDRLWLAAEDHGTIDSFELRSLKPLASVPGVVFTPHSILHVPGKGRLIVTDTGGDMQTRILDAKTLRPTGNVRLAAPGADAFGLDPSSGFLYIVNGGRDARLAQTYISVLDPVTLERHGDLRFDTDKVESVAIESHGTRMYITVTGRNEVVVADKTTLAVLATWPVREAQQSAPLAFDEPGRRLFVIARKPGTLIVLDADSGRTVASFPAPARCDQVLWDAANRRVYALGGDGTIGVWVEVDKDHYTALPRIASAQGAKTGILVPELGQMIVGVSAGEGGKGGAILRYDVLPAMAATGASR